MIGTSAMFSQKIAESSRQFRARLLYEGAAVSGEIRNITINKGACGESFSIGSIYSSYIEVTLDKCDEILENKELLLQIGLVIDDTVDYIDMGYYTVTKPSRSTYQTTFTAVGRITSKLNCLPTLPAEQTLAKLAAAITEATGVQIICKGVTLAGTIEEDLAGLTCRELLEVITAILGGFATEDNAGNIVISKFSMADLVHFNGERTITDPEFSDYDYELTGVKVTTTEEWTDEDGTVHPEVSFTEGTPRQTLSMKYMTESLFSAFKANVVGYTYRPGTIPLALGDPRLDPWDCILYTDAKGNAYVVPCLSIVHTFDGGLSTVITAPGESESESESQVKGPLVQKMERIAYQIFTAEQAIVRRITADEADLKYATIKTLVATEAKITNLSGEFVSFKTGEFETLKANAITAETLESKVGEFGYLKASELESEVGKFGYLKADEAALNYATINELNALSGTVTALTSKAITTDNLSAKVGEFGYLKVAELEAEVAEFGYLKADTADLKYATIKSLEATEASVKEISGNFATFKEGDFKNLQVEVAEIDAAYMDEAEVNSLVVKKGYLTEAQVNTLVAGKGYITELETNHLLTDYAKVTELNAVDSKITNLNAKAINTDNLSSKIADFGFITAAEVSADYATIKSLDAAEAQIESLSGEVGTFKSLTTGQITAIQGDIQSLNTNTVKASELESKVAEFGYAKAEDLEAESADIRKLFANYATVGQLNATNGNITTLSSTVAEINSAYMDEAEVESLVAGKGYITTAKTNTLLSEYVKTSTLTSNYATINSLNAAIGRISNIESDYVKTNMLVGKYVLVEDILADSLAASTGNFTKYLTGVQIHGDLIYAETLKADSLILQGEDGIYRRLNIDSLGETVVDSDSKYNEKLDGSVLVANSVTATQIAAGTITATQIKSASITVDRLDADQLKARVGTYGYLVASELSAEVAKLGYATADSLEAAVGRFSNYVLVSNYNSDKSTMQSDISEAQSAANSANTAAGNAQTKANSAYTLANTANGIANSALTNANTANSVLSNWCYENNTTYIDGGKIYTGTIEADAINADTLSAITADLGTVTAGVIQSKDFATSDYNATAGGGSTGTVTSGLKIDLTNKAYYTPQITIKDNYIDLRGYMTIGRRIDEFDNTDHDVGKFSLSVGACYASGNFSACFGADSYTTGHASFASGSSKATGDFSHAEGLYTRATGYDSHSEGYGTHAAGGGSHAEGQSTTASGANSHAEGYQTHASYAEQHVQGRFNILDSENKYAHIVGNGDWPDTRSNAHTLDWSGNAWYAGDVIAGGTQATDGTVTGGVSLKKSAPRYIVGTGTTAGTWLGTDDSITEYFDGLTVLYKVGIAGASTTTLNINGLGAVQVMRNASSAVTTHYGVNSIVLLTYTTDDGTGYWKIADYDANSYAYVRQYYTTTNGNYPLLSKYDAGITTTTNYVTKYSRYSNKFYINPSTGVLTAPTFKGALDGNAATATKATQDSDGNVISSTYAKTEHTHSYLPLSGGDLTGNLTGKYITGTWLQTTATTDLGSVPSKIAVLDSSGWVYYRTPAEMLSDIGAAALSHTHSYLSLSGGTLTGQLLISTGTTQSATKGIKWAAINTKNPYIGYATDQSDGTFVVGSLLGTNYASGLAIGGGSGNLLWKGNKVAVTSDISLATLGITATATELNYCDGVTSNIQTQLNGKATSGHTHSDLYNTDGTQVATVANDSAGYYFRPVPNISLILGSSSNPFYKTFTERLEVTAERIKCLPSYETTTTYATNIYVNSAGWFTRTTNTSSRTIKRDIKELSAEELKAENLYRLPVHQFKYNEGVITDKGDVRYMKNLPGFIIEEVNDVYPIAVDKPGDDVKDWSWNAQYMIPPMLKLIQDQHSEDIRMDSEIRSIRSELISTQNKLNAAMMKIAEQEKQIEQLMLVS